MHLGPLAIDPLPLSPLGAAQHTPLCVWGGTWKLAKTGTLGRKPSCNRGEFTQPVLALTPCLGSPLPARRRRHDARTGSGVLGATVPQARPRGRWSWSAWSLLPPFPPPDSNQGRRISQGTHTHPTHAPRPRPCLHGTPLIPLPHATHTQAHDPTPAAGALVPFCLVVPSFSIHTPKPQIPLGVRTTHR